MIFLFVFALVGSAMFGIYNIYPDTSTYSIPIDHRMILHKRDLHKLYVSKMMDKTRETIREEYQPIYDMVVYRAKHGITGLDFHLFCFRVEMMGLGSSPMDKNYLLLSKMGNPGMNSKLPKKYMVLSVLHNVQRSFPDIPIETVSYNNSSQPYPGQCEEYYTISW